MSAMPIDGLVIDSRFYPLLNAYLACLSPPVEIRKRIAVLSVFSIYVTFISTNEHHTRESRNEVRGLKLILQPHAYKQREPDLV
jgi:hypothetical protein